MSSITATGRQYADSEKLAARARLNGKHTIAEMAWFPWVLQQLPLRPGDRVLDIGCGPGWLWQEMSDALPRNLDLVLADASAGMVSEAEERTRGLPVNSVTTHQADAMSMPFEDASFDVVLAMHMLYHVPDQAKAIAEMFRVLRPGGVLAVTTNGRENMRELYALTTVLGSPELDPSGVAFGFETAERLLGDQFGNVELRRYPSRLHVTDPEDVFMALTSYPPGDGADEQTLEAFRQRIDAAFEQGGGVLVSEKETGVFISTRPR